MTFNIHQLKKKNLQRQKEFWNSMFRNADQTIIHILKIRAGRYLFSLHIYNFLNLSLVGNMFLKLKKKKNREKTKIRKFYPKKEESS